MNRDKEAYSLNHIYDPFFDVICFCEDATTLWQSSEREVGPSVLRKFTVSRYTPSQMQVNLLALKIETLPNYIFTYLMNLCKDI